MHPTPTTLSALPWQSRFVSRFPGDPEPRNFVRRVRNVLYSITPPTPVSAPRLLAWSTPLSADLGLAPPNDHDIALLAGNLTLPAMRPYAARYGGHQFGHWADQLGDGRALTLGELEFPRSGRPEGTPPRLEFQLKGAGPTPYSRHADGRAVLRSSLREFLCSEAMHHLGVPTTRALSLVSTGDPVTRDMFYDGHPAPEPGAIVCRVAPTFLRFGNFEILAAHGELDLLRQLADFLIADFYPELDPRDPGVYAHLLDTIATRTATLIAHWQRVGFVHGVMNTDNMSAINVTIDYGPYGWLEPYDPGWTPNTTDAQSRRYRFGAQPAVALWNLARLAEALHPLIDNEDRLYKSLELYQSTFTATHQAFLAQKLGLASVTADDDKKLVDDLFTLLQSAETDYTIFFRRLSDWPVRADHAASRDTFLDHVAPAFYSDTIEPDLLEKWDDWSNRYTRRVLADPTPDADRSASMKRVNPKYVPRNYLAQLAIDAATQGDLAPLHRLMKVLEHPYDDQPENTDLAARRPDWARNTPGCSALSCSS